MINVVLVDDEFPSLKIIENFCLKFSEFQVVAKFNSAIEAMSFVETEKVDMLFLDIQMPGII